MGFLYKTQLWVPAAHIPGTINIEADKQSRVVEDATEWKFNPALFYKIAEKFRKPNIYLFATRINKQLDRYVSWHPEADAMAVTDRSCRTILDTLNNLTVLIR